MRIIRNVTQGMERVIGAAILGACLMTVSLASPAAADTCYTPGPGGTCLDGVITPKTGQRTTMTNEYNGQAPAGFKAPSDARASQHHGAVKLRENAYIDAHNICRYVDNKATKGPGLYLGLESKGEWSSAIANPPPGATFTPCCRPVVVEVCGASSTIPYSKLGAATTVTGGHSRVVTYTCANTTAGVVPTADTSWLSAASGQCEAPARNINCDARRYEGLPASQLPEECRGGGGGKDHESPSDPGGKGSSGGDKGRGGSGGGGSGGGGW